MDEQDSDYQLARGTPVLSFNTREVVFFTILMAFGIAICAVPFVILYVIVRFFWALAHV